MASEAETSAMRTAIELAARGLPTASPNPVVGCVVLDADSRRVGSGWHERPGGPHAEVAALREAGPAARGGTAVVTLEPCRHTGRTGPCTQALLNAGIARVVVAVPDPTAAAGGGADLLRSSGVAVETGVLAAEAEAGNLRWLRAARLGRPHITWKYAATLDGRVAAADGTSRWITSPEARADVHRLRASMDAVIAGIGTVLADDPHLTVRTGQGLAVNQPLRVVVDSAGRTPASARVRDDAAATWVATADEVGAGADGRVDLTELARKLYARGVLAALLEGGPRLAGAFLDAGLVDSVVGYIAPALLGGGSAALESPAASTISDIRRLHITAVERVGPDLRIVATPLPAAPEGN